MLDKLRTPSAMKNRALNAARAPFETLGQATNFIKSRVKTALEKISEFKLELRHGVNKRETEKWIQSMILLPEEQRREAIHALFEEGMNGNHETLYNLMRKLADMDILGLIEEERGAEGLSEDDMLLPLELDYELFSEAIAAAQNSNKFDDWLEFLNKKNAPKKSDKSNGFDHLTLDGAALPEMFPKIMEYEDRLSKHVKERGGRKGKSFNTMTRAFKKIVEQVFGKDFEGFYGFGTTPTAKSLILRFWEYYPKAELIADQYEYLPLYYLVQKDQRHMVSLPNGLDFTEEDMVKALLKKGEEIISKRGDQISDPIVLLVSSQPRIGGKLLDTQKIAKLIEAENQKIGHKQYHIWFDSSQDSRIIKDGDITLYSKRFGGTGAGLFLAKKETYPEDRADIKEAFRTRSGYPFRHIPRIVASLFSESKRVGHRFKDLLNPGTESLWHYSGKGTFVENEIKNAQAELKSTSLDKFFTISSALPESDSGQWRINAIVRFELTDEGREVIDLNELQRDLNSLNVTVSNFNLESCEAEDDKPGFKKLMETFNAEPFNLAQFISIAEDFQKYYQQGLVTTLIPEENKEDADYVKKYFSNAVRQHNYFRVFVTAIDRPNTLRDFVKRLGTAVQKQKRL